jgi:cobalt-zinc-cadmium efflux system protein
MSNRLWASLAISVALLAAEIAGGILSNSLALLGDAGHLLTDQFAIVIGLVGIRQAGRAATPTMTYGYHRMGVLLATLNALLLIAVSLAIFAEASRRFLEPPEIKSSLMLVVALVGLAGNLVMVALLRPHSHRNLSMRAAFLHVMGDTLSSIGILIGGGFILATGMDWIDPLVSIFIGLVIIFSAWGVVKTGLSVFLEAAPPGMDTNVISKAILSVPQVKEVHDLHIWSLDPNMVALSCHIQTDEHSVEKIIAIRGSVHQMLHTQFNIAHTTIQMELTHYESLIPMSTLGKVSNSAKQKPTK